MSCASRRVGRKGDRRAEEVGSLIVPPGIPAVRGMPLSESSGLRRVAIVVCVGGEALELSCWYVELELFANEDETYIEASYKVPKLSIRVRVKSGGLLIKL
jgi:hypothetical protein